ncbi:hypothetical protein [Salipiger marinus]|uniref:hypothetical protein n=1 Tax=Salipiger marinus TaxID=555512 RepID=UPI00405A1DBC
MAPDKQMSTRLPRSGRMVFASSMTMALFRLAETMSAHTATSLEALSGRAVSKGGFFKGLARESDCTTATAERVLLWLDGFWPEDLDWPSDLIARPSGLRVPSVSGARLAEISNEPIWANGRRPPWWSDLEVREFLTSAHRQMSLLQAEAVGQSRFGARCPRKSAIHTYWQRLDRLHALKKGVST